MYTVKTFYRDADCIINLSTKLQLAADRAVSSKQWPLLRSAVGMTHVFQERLVMGYADFSILLV